MQYAINVIYPNRHAVAALLSRISQSVRLQGAPPKSHLLPHLHRQLRATRNVGPETNLGNGPRNDLNWPGSDRPNASELWRYGKTATGLMVEKVKV